MESHSFNYVHTNDLAMQKNTLNKVEEAWQTAIDVSKPFQFRKLKFKPDSPLYLTKTVAFTMPDLAASPKAQGKQTNHVIDPRI